MNIQEAILQLLELLCPGEYIVVQEEYRKHQSTDRPLHEFKIYVEKSISSGWTGTFDTVENALRDALRLIHEGKQGEELVEVENDVEF